jgi:hypothetical protein
MKIEKTALPNIFDLKEISFTQLKTIRDACAAFSKQGSATAGTIASELGSLLDDLIV